MDRQVFGTAVDQRLQGCFLTSVQRQYLLNLVFPSLNFLFRLALCHQRRLFSFFVSRRLHVPECQLKTPTS